MLRALLCTMALVAASVAAHAGTIAIQPNKAGGEIRLTDDGTHLMCREHEAMVYATGNKSNRILKGCYSIDEADEIIFIRWDHRGDTTVHSVRDFEITKYGRERMVRGLGK